MSTIVLQLITAFLGSLGFSLLFHLRKQLLLPASIGGLLCWGIYLIGTHYYEGVFVPCLLASASAALYAEILARIKKAPATVFLVPAVVPAIPGSTLYYAMSNAVQGEWDIARSYGYLTIQYALAIAGGISLVWAMSVMLQNVNKQK